MHQRLVLYIIRLLEELTVKIIAQEEKMTRQKKTSHLSKRKTEYLFPQKIRLAQMGEWKTVGCISRK